MIHEHILFGYNYDDEQNILIPNDVIKHYGFFSTFTLMLTSIIEVYRKFNKLPDISGRNLLKHLSQEDDIDMYHKFFHINENVRVEIDANEIPPISPDSHHTIYAEENLKYIKPFFDRYFNTNSNINQKIELLEKKYNINLSNTIGVVIRGTDKWTDFGGFPGLTPGAYIRLVEKILTENKNSKVILQTEHADVQQFFQNKFRSTIFSETLTAQNGQTPLFLSLKENKLEWAEYYIASLWILAKSKYLITYTGNSSFFLFLRRGTTKNMYQEITFTQNVSDFFAKDEIVGYKKVRTKMSPGEIIDRYTICLLKSERLKLDVNNELTQLRLDIDEFPSTVREYINKLKDINESIWNLEADIRNGKEELLGLEEVGKRALEIRNFNNTRVNYKNEINSIMRVGFADTKINHVSENPASLVISLTTVPERLRNEHEEGIKLVLKALCEQTDDDYEVHFNVPQTYNITGKTYVIPEWVENYKLKYPHFKVFRTDDFGPPTKFIPTVERVSDETIILVIDDDLVYHEDMVKEHRKYQQMFKDCVICYDGRGSNPKYNDIRDAWVACVVEPTETHGLQHYKSASYKKKLFDQDFYKFYMGKTLSDDVLVGRYFRDKGIKMYCVPYEPEIHKVLTRELWDAHLGVETFPVLRYAVSIPDTGCNHPGILKIQPKFYEPVDLRMPTTEVIYPLSENTFYMNKQVNFSKFNTDKKQHGYFHFYEKFFNEISDCKNFLEIGVCAGDSILLFKELFSDAIIHGMDIRQCSFDDMNRLKLYEYDQENIQHLNEFVKSIDFEFDAILDDGGHTMRQQQTSFGVLFKKVKSGGIYIIEDLHTSKLPNFLTPDAVVTTLDMLQKLNSDKILVSNYIDSVDANYIVENVESIHIWSATEDFSQSVTAVIKKR